MNPLSIYAEQHDERGSGEDFAEIRAMGPMTPAETIHGFLWRCLRRPDLYDLLPMVAERTGVPFDRLRQSLARLHQFSCLTVTSEWVELAVNVLEAHGRGLYLRSRPDKSFVRYDGLCWEDLPEPALRNELTTFILSNDLTGSDDPTLMATRTIAVLRDLQMDTGPDVEPQPVINCLDGEIWIRPDGSHQLRAHRPESGLRQVLPVDYSRAPCPKFSALLEGIFRDAEAPEEMIRHVSEIMAYALTPQRDLEVMVLWQGGGHNGKSTLAKILQALIGREGVYASSVGNLSDRFNQPDLRGKLLFFEDDAGEGFKLDDGLLKKLSGNSVMTTRRMRTAHGETFSSTVLPLILCNGMPTISDSSAGLERRLLCVPFTRRFTKAERDDTLVSDILDSELSGVLAFLLRALARLRERGHFDEPAECVEARERLLAASNPLRAFLDERCEADDKARLGISAFYDVFAAWSLKHSRGLKFPLARMAAKLGAMGYRIGKSSGVSTVYGLKWRQPQND